MEELFFEKPILNSPYEYPLRHWELDNDGQPTHKIIDSRRVAQFITPIPQAQKAPRGQGSATDNLRRRRGALHRAATVRARHRRGE